MTVAVAKCNITELALNALAGLLYESQCEDSSYAIVENYIEYLNCPDIDLVVCHPDDCKNETVVFTCLINVPNLTLDVNGSTLTYSTVIAGGTPPFTYAWTFNQNYFTASSGTNQDTLVITAKSNLDITTLVSQVTVVVTDANGCIDSKSCWISELELKCNVNFVPCVNPSNLRIKNKVTYCVAPSNLRVHKK